MNEAKVNTKNSDFTSAQAKKAVFSKDHAGFIETPYGAHLIKRGAAKDQAHMRTRQLGALLRVMQTETRGAERFCMLSDQDQSSLVWLAAQMADELDILLDLVAADAREGWV